MPTNIQPIHVGLPQINEIPLTNIFLRDCYAEYYRLIVENHLPDTNCKYITVTGTPGIGKSAFYLYFFKRFRSENPDKTVITASFGSFIMKDCVIFRPNGPADGEGLDAVPKIRDALYLFDGAPSIETAHGQMITFTSPYFPWIRRMKKKSNHVFLYMPCWTLNELLEANEFLHLGLDDDEIEERFLFLGGTARYCLTTNVDYYALAVETIRSSIKGIKSYSYLEDCWSNVVDKSDISHSLFHYVPMPSRRLPHYPNNFYLTFCSSEVATLVESNILDKSYERRRELARWLDGNSAAAPFMGWLFEGYCRAILEAGSNFEIKSLTSGRRSSMLLAGGNYRHAKTGNMESIDGFYFDKGVGKLYLFQITRSPTHPVKAHGIIKLFEELNLSPQMVLKMDIKLIFVVPAEIKSFKKQSIIFDNMRGNMNSPVTAIRGIGTKALAHLSDFNIVTVRDLQDAIDLNMDEAMRYTARLEKFRAFIAAASQYRGIEQISQFVLYIPGKFE